MNKIFFKSIIISFIFLPVFILAWQEPSQTPPEGNVSPPINTGAAAQSKEGPISAAQFGDIDSPDYYLNPSGDSKISTLMLASSERPQSLEKGQIYFDAGLKKMFYYDGENWIDFQE